MQAFINEYYRYPNSKQNFKLVRHTEFVYFFECGHWCTDSVFMDLIRVKTGVPNYKMQYELQL